MKSAPTFAEVTTWSAEEIVEGIKSLLTGGQSFTYSLLPEGFYSAQILMGEVPLWHGEHADERLLLLNAFGWAYTRRPTTKTHPAWVRGTPPMAQTHAGPQQHIESKELVDLDPTEIDAVYGAKK